jgi:hypothetical protein
MYLLRKWDYETHQYFPFISPAKFLTLYSEDMELELDCACCGEHAVYGNMYTSRTIHNDSGIGFWVCEKCYNKELDEEDRFRQEHPGESTKD